MDKLPDTRFIHVTSVEYFCVFYYMDSLFNERKIDLKFSSFENLKIFRNQAKFDNFRHENRDSEDFKIPQNPQFHLFARKNSSTYKIAIE